MMVLVTVVAALTIHSMSLSNLAFLWLGSLCVEEVLTSNASCTIVRMRVYMQSPNEHHHTSRTIDMGYQKTFAEP